MFMSSELITSSQILIKIRDCGVGFNHLLYMLVLKNIKNNGGRFFFGAIKIGFIGGFIIRKGLALRGILR